MHTDTHDPESVSTDDRGGGVTRRTLLKTTAVAAVGGAAIAAGSGSGAADSDQILEVDFRGGTPPITDAPQGEDEVLFSIHGYSGSSVSVSQSRTLQQTARSLGYTETVTAVTWDDSGGPTAAESSARNTGGRLANWLDDYVTQNPQTKVRLLGHSMGGFVVFECLAGINGAFQIENADMIGSYEEASAPCEGNGFFDAIESSCLHMGNYYSTNDSIARLGSGPADCGGGGGWFGGGGGGGTTPSNYYDYDVSGSVPSHTSYKSSSGCVQQIIGNYNYDVDRGGSGDGTPPTAPTSLSSGSADSSSVDLNWSASSDSGGSGLDHYNVYVDGSVNSQVAAGNSSTTVSNLSSGTNYDFYVTAVDGAGNESGSSNTITVSTDSGSGGSGGWW